MPRINLRVLWFEDIGFVNQGVIDTPFGRLSARQFAGIGLFALLAWVVFESLSFVGDLLVRIVPPILVLMVGVIIFTWKVKTIPPEKTLLLMLGIGRKTPKRRLEVTARKKKTVPPKVERAPAARVRKAQAVVGEPFKIVGTLSDPRSGKPLANRTFEVFANGISIFKDVTDEQGSFQIVHIPQHPGIMRISVKPEGIVGADQSVEVSVTGGTG